MFTSATGERAVRQREEPDFPERRDFLMERGQHLPKRHLHLGVAGKACCCMCLSHVKK